MLRGTTGDTARALLGGNLAVQVMSLAVNGGEAIAGHLPLQGGSASILHALLSAMLLVALRTAQPPSPTAEPAPLNTGKPLFRRPWPYVAGVAGVAVAAIIVIFATRSVHNLGCLVGQTTLGHRTTTLHNAFVDVYNRDFKVIDACTSVDCEKAPKLEIAGSLKTYNDGLNAVCWPDKYKAHATALMQANTAMADAFTTWATAATPAEDQSLQTAAKEQDDRQGVADDILSIDLGVPLPTNAPS